LSSLKQDISELSTSVLPGLVGAIGKGFTELLLKEGNTNNNTIAMLIPVLISILILILTGNTTTDNDEETKNDDDDNDNDNDSTDLDKLDKLMVKNQVTLIPIPILI